MHQWEILKTSSVWDDDTSSKYPIGEKFTLQCKMCGDIKVRKNY